MNTPIILRLRERDQIRAIVSAWNQGIDARLEAVTDSTYEACGGVFQFNLSLKDAKVMRRRLVRAKQPALAQMIHRQVIMPQISEVTRHYLLAALWTDTCDDDSPLDDRYTVGDVDFRSRDAAESDCRLFIAKAGALLEGIPDSQVGHDFWLTRNHHGVGFWDRGLGDRGDKLTTIAESFPERTAFENGDTVILE